jgi:hypothetical protein
MSDVIKRPAKTDAEYKAEVERLMQEMDLLFEQMDKDRAESEKLKAESKVIEARSKTKLAELEKLVKSLSTAP